MALPRRKFLRLAACAVAMPALARAETYPSRPIHLIIGYLPGGSADMTARLFGQWLSDRLGQQIVVESRAGASTNIATEAVVRAAPDGYTLLLVSPTNATNAALYEKLNFDFLRDIDPVAGLIRFPDVVDVNLALPVEIVDRLNREANAILAEPATKARLAELGASLLPGSPADFGKLVADETEKWGKVIRFAGSRLNDIGVARMSEATSGALPLRIAPHIAALMRATR
jgi:tripartite-type tricarboxylate transporter receptor subunit TctC